MSETRECVYCRHDLINRPIAWDTEFSTDDWHCINDECPTNEDTQDD